MTQPSPSAPLCGIWIDDWGGVHVSVARPDGGREERREQLRPFVWLGPGDDAPTPAGITIESLQGTGTFPRLAHGDDFKAFSAFVRSSREGDSSDVIRPWESQYLLQQRQRLFEGLAFGQLRRCQLAVELAADEGGADPGGTVRISAVTLGGVGGGQRLVLAGATDAGERALLERFGAALVQADPDVVEGHDVFKFDLEWLRQRCRQLKVACAWGRFGQKAEFRNSRLKVAERWIDFPRCDLPGRAVVDTALLAQLHDITAREFTSYLRRDVAVALGLAADDAPVPASGTPEAAAEAIREIQTLAALMLPTYFEQTRTFPILLEEAALKGTTGKIDLLFLEEYYHARHAVSAPAEVAPFEGGYARSFQEGVFRHVLHFDVASLYPSLLLQIARNPRHDPLGVFIPLLRRLREYRLRYKQLARTAATAEERAEAQARQTNFKILINSFYGYLGFPAARFGDGELAAEVTRRGRELLQQLIDEFVRHGCTILEADTDGIYLASEKYHREPAALLALVASILPPGIELEFDGSYEAMFCYKAKNYALFDGERIVLRGSALRSRGIEPFLKRLTDALIAFLLGARPDSPLVLLEALRTEIRAGRLPVDQLAKSETLGQNPESYERWIAEGGKPRRAAAEAALQLAPRPRMGERVTYYLTAKAKGKTSDWQRARPIQRFDPVAAPYAPDYYLEKLDDWLERYGGYLGVKSATETQGELL